MVIIREQLRAQVPYLRFLCGVNRSRAMQVPVFSRNAIGAETKQAVGVTTHPTATVTVFHVVGFGATEARARAMAESALGTCDFVKFDAREAEPSRNPLETLAA